MEKSHSKMELQNLVELWDTMKKSEIPSDYRETNIIRNHRINEKQL